MAAGRRVYKLGERSWLHRKVHMRIAALGLSTHHLMIRLFPEILYEGPKVLRNRRQQLNRLLERPEHLHPNWRGAIESALMLPEGSLLDEVPISVVALAPMPPAYNPSPDHKPVPMQESPNAPVKYPAQVGALQLLAEQITEVQEQLSHHIEGEDYSDALDLVLAQEAS